MSGETLGGHMIRSLEAATSKIKKAADKGPGEALNKEADNLIAELDRLTELLTGENNK